MPRSPILPLLLGGLLCLGGTAYGQQQEEKIDRILHPDLNKSFNVSMQKKFGSNTFDSRTSRVVELKTVSESRKYNIKSFLTGEFRSDKSFWMGDFKYSAKEANTQSRSLFTLPGKSFSTKPMAVKDAAGADKHYDVASVPTRDFRGKEREKLQSQLTPEQATYNGYRGELKELKSIDDVRALLNKSK
ncbi:MAG: hypothetical protein NTZ46_06160 [Verrucomicrobia bacterium]|nr:hypothetical protein [Verrucomicrobiota bacterium]